MFGENTQEQSDPLATPENFERGEKVYARVTSAKCKDVTAELNDTYGR